MINLTNSLTCLTAFLVGAPLLASAQPSGDELPNSPAVAPQAVSPGAQKAQAPEASWISETCPTFSWGAVEDAERYELAIYDAQWNPSTEAQAQADSGQPLQQIAIDAPATAWTPAGDQCLEGGADCVWFVRAETEEGLSPWSKGASFTIDFDADGLSQAVRRELSAQLSQPHVWREGLRQVFGDSLLSSTTLTRNRMAVAIEDNTSSHDGDPAELSARETLSLLSSPTPQAAATSFPNPSALKTSGPNGVVFGGTFGEGGIPAEGAGTRFMWYPGKSALRAGTVTGTDWDDPDVGDYSVALGLNTTASGTYSTAMGRETLASGDWSTAMGGFTRATAGTSTAMGYGAVASGSASVAVGVFASATGHYSIAMGSNTLARSAYEMVIGRYNEDYNPISPTGWNADDHLFVIGNGTSDASRSNAVVVEKSGNVGLGRSFASYQLHLSRDSAAKPGTTTWQTTSDARLKRVSGAYEPGLEAIARLNPVRFHYEVDNARGHDPAPEYVGFIAQEVEPVIPEAISEGTDGYLDFNMHAVNVALVNAVKELKAQNDAQQARIDALEAENAQLAVRQDQALEQQVELAVLREHDARLSAMQSRLSKLESALVSRKLVDGDEKGSVALAD